MQTLKRSQEEKWPPIMHETLFISAFIIKEKKERYLNLLSSKKGRAKFRLKLPHLQDINKTYLHKIAPNEQNIAHILNQLRSYNSPPNCHIMAEHSKYDQKTMQIEDALQTLFASGISYIISCIPGKLLYYEGENINERYMIYYN